MKVCALIKHLQAFEPDAEIYISDWQSQSLFRTGNLNRFEKSEWIGVAPSPEPWMAMAGLKSAFRGGLQQRNTASLPHRVHGEASQESAWALAVRQSLGFNADEAAQLQKLLKVNQN